MLYYIILHYIISYITRGAGVERRGALRRGAPSADHGEAPVFLFCKRLFKLFKFFFSFFFFF